MKQFFISLLVFGAITPVSLAAEGETPAQDLTIEFFTALQTCTPGVYRERNVLSASVGPVWLQQMVVGEEENACKVVLYTPDGRNMNCYFPRSELSMLADNHFMQGMADNSQDNPSKDSVDADAVWSDLKLQYCAF